MADYETMMASISQTSFSYNSDRTMLRLLTYKQYTILNSEFTETHFEINAYYYKIWKSKGEEVVEPPQVNKYIMNAPNCESVQRLVNDYDSINCFVEYCPGEITKW